MLPGARSIYRWKGVVEEETEVLLMIKSSRGLFNQLRSELERMHSYEVPECLMLAVEDGDTAYLEWIGESVP